MGRCIVLLFALLGVDFRSYLHSALRIAPLDAVLQTDRRYGGMSPLMWYKRQLLVEVQLGVVMSRNRFLAWSKARCQHSIVQPHVE